VGQTVDIKHPWDNFPSAYGRKQRCTLRFGRENGLLASVDAEGTVQTDGNIDNAQRVNRPSPTPLTVKSLAIKVNMEAPRSHAVVDDQQ
jgi:hypothetical protein